MRRILGEHFTLYGKPKRRFKSRQHALDFLVSKRQTDTYHTYHCSFCDGWHIATNR